MSNFISGLVMKPSNQGVLISSSNYSNSVVGRRINKKWEERGTETEGEEKGEEKGGRRKRKESEGC